MVTPGAAGWRLPVLVLVGGLLSIGVLLIAGDGLRPGASAATTAIVLEAADCSEPGARDTVETIIDDGAQPIPLNGCGNVVGTAVEVELVGEGDLMVAHLAVTGSSAAAGLSGQLNVLLFLLAAASGSLLVTQVRTSRALSSQN